MTCWRASIFFFGAKSVLQITRWRVGIFIFFAKSVLLPKKAQALVASKTILPKLKTQNTSPLTTLNSFPTDAALHRLQGSHKTTLTTKKIQLLCINFKN